ncbi:MAG: serine/threonine-protein kinase [Acidobacteriota bacterium]|nr:serine/threonine-protein kinase [Acidobacteriota bacterium]
MLTTGSRLGPYEILAPLGAGGMGEVYRARDERLRRDVAIKVLSGDLSADADRRKRFEQEARAASSLNHHNLVTIHDIGSMDGVVYIAMELVEGRTLRDLKSEGPLPTKRLLDVAFQMADGLAKAHGAGIVHRDLKPENVMVTRDGVVKILDFGLAKLLPRDGELSQDSATAIEETRPGTVLGTIGYMSPEQASGRPADFRSDQFSLGSMLYEMATGKRAFERATTAETLTAIIREEAEPVGKLNVAVPAPFRWLIERCLSKDPEGRYAATRDLASDLRSIRDHLSEASVSGEISSGASPVPPRQSGSALRGGLAAIAILAALGAGMLLEKRLHRTTPPSYQQITFGSGTIRSARFAPDGQTIVYSVAWDGNPLKLFLKHPSSPDSLPLALPSSNLLGISPSGEMAIALDCRSNHPGVCAGTLARAALTGGSPRGVAEGIQEADWAADGEKMLVVRDVDGKARIEYPLGKVLYQTSGHVSYARLSPRGDRIAFLDHPFPLDDAGTVAVIDLEGRKTTLTGKWASEHGLAWAPSGSEIWFTATEAGANRSLYAADLAGKLRVVARVPGGLKLHDIAKSGRVLLTRESPRVGIRGALSGDERERDMSFLDYSFAADLAPDGKTLLFDEEGEAGGANYTVFLRKSDNSPVVRLGEGNALALSPDGKWALSIIPQPDTPFLLLPTGTGEHLQVPLAGVSAEQGAAWLPDSKAFVFGGSEKGHAVRIYLQSLSGGKPRAITPEGVTVALPGFAVTGDGKSVAAIGPDGKCSLYPVDGGTPKPLPGILAGEFPLRFSPDDRYLYLWKRGDIPARVTRLEVATGKRDLWKDLMPADPAGVERISNVLIAPDAKSWAYCYARLLSDLFVVEGLK